jgi:hypothetical protein
MATIQSSKQLRARMWGGHAVVVERAPDVDWASPPLAQALGQLGKLMLGVLLLLLGSGLLLTLWLLPVGLPLALLGTALIAAPSNSRST